MRDLSSDVRRGDYIEISIEIYVVDVADAVPHSSSIAGVGDADGNVVVVHTRGFRIDAPTSG